MKKTIYKLFLSIFTSMILAIQCSALVEPEINEVVSIDFLDNKSVFIFKSKCIDIEGISYQVGTRDAMSFENSDEGRQFLTENVTEPYLSAILGVWGNSEETCAKELSENSSETADVHEVLSINPLDNKSVVILKTNYINIDGIDYTLGEPQVISYENSTEGRESLAENIPDPFFSAVMAVWGDTPTVTLPVDTLPIDTLPVESQSV